MFRNIQFIVNDSDEPLSNMEELHLKLDRDDAYPEYSSRLSHYRFFENCSFYIDGRSSILPLYPVSGYAMQNLTYIQSFSMLEAGKRFYTRRSGADSYMLLFTYGGEGACEYEGKKYHLREGDGLLIDCKNEHYYYTEGASWHHSVLHFSGDFPGQVLQEMSRTGEYTFHQDTGGHYQHSLERLLEIYDMVVPCRELQISCLLNQMLMDILTGSKWYQEQTSQMPESINMLVRYIGSHYMKPLTLEHLAARSSMSRYHLCKSFKKHTGYSPTEYVIWQRIEHAKSLLGSTAIPANQIGRMVGIEDENYFYRLFRTKVGCSPIAYRKGR